MKRKSTRRIRKATRRLRLPSRRWTVHATGSPKGQDIRGDLVVNNTGDLDVRSGSKSNRFEAGGWEFAYAGNGRRLLFVGVTDQRWSHEHRLLGCERR
jgi:hypothetical protein